MNVVMVKFGGIQRGVKGQKISFSLGAWFSCVEQKDRQEGLFFNLGFTGREASCCRGIVESECLMVQRNFQQGR